MISVRDIAWLAGLWEGEGAFMVDGRHAARMSLQMTDEDVVRRAAELMRATVQGPIATKRKRSDGSDHKLRWRINLTVQRSAEWMMTLYPLMGERRRLQIEKCLARWREVKIRGRTPDCHPDRKHQAHGLCVTCYNRNCTRRWREREALRASYC